MLKLGRFLSVQFGPEIFDRTARLFSFLHKLAAACARSQMRVRLDQFPRRKHTLAVSLHGLSRQVF
jgi:hypothetical protein